MKVVHLCLGAFFPDNYSYQENMLPKFHKYLGYDVEVIASQETFDKNGNTSYLDFSGTYMNEYDIKVTRVNYSFPKKLNHKLKHYEGVYDALCCSKPDIIFMHNLQFLSIFSVIKYLKKNPQVKLYVDNHVDFSNSAKNWISKNILHGCLWRLCAQKINPYVKNFYGVLPARVDFLVNIYKLPTDKVSLLVMGCDDEKLHEATNNNSRELIRKKYGIEENDVLLMTGGKIDAWKKQTLLLMQAVSELKYDNLKLLVFGSVTEELKESVESLTLPNKVQYIGWIEAVESYKYWSAADIAVFPGRHSVFWEQVAGMGIPLICKYWDGTTHVDLGGNVEFLHNDSIDEIKSVIVDIMENKSKLVNMKEAARRSQSYFSYEDISRRSIEVK